MSTDNLNGTLSSTGNLNGTFGSSGGGGTSNYNDLANKPQINGNTLEGNKTPAQLGINIPDMTNYYNKSETNTLLDGKANVSDLPDMNDYYDKSETDNLLDGKADVSDLPDMNNYYNKSETDNLLDGKVDNSRFNAASLPIESGSATNTKAYIDNSINAPIKASEVVSIPDGDLAVGSNWSEGCFYVKRNGLIILHLALKGLTANDRNTVYTLPSNCRPSVEIVGAGMGGLSYTAFAQATITTGGVIHVSSVDTYARIHLMYYVNE